MAHPEALDGIIVVKVGSSTLVGDRGSLDRGFLDGLCRQLADLVERGKRPVLVSSGAVAVGVERLGLPGRPQDMPGVQACAACGQAALTEAYAEAMAALGLKVAQVLLTKRDVMDREGYLNARSTLDRLLELGVVPVVNENDTVSSEECQNVFGDNDMLGAIVSALLGAEQYVVLSDIDGLYTANPAEDPDAVLVESVGAVDGALLATAGGAGSSVGTGGMATKLRAARALLAAGIPMTIANGRRAGVVVDCVEGRGRRTDFRAPDASREQARKLWIGLATQVRGSVTLDAGAVRALRERGASLLPVGVTSVDGTFRRGDVVSVLDPEGGLLGRGVSRFSSRDLDLSRGLTSDVVARFFPDLADQPAIHRDELLVF